MNSLVTFRIKYLRTKVMAKAFGVEYRIFGETLKEYVEISRLD